MRTRVEAERRVLDSSRPSDPKQEIRELEEQRRRIEEWRRDLYGRAEGLANHPVGRAVRELEHIETNLERLGRNLAARGPRAQRRAWRKEADERRQRHVELSRELEELRRPEGAYLQGLDDDVVAKLEPLLEQRRSYEAWVEAHPGAEQRLRALDAELRWSHELLAPAPPVRDRSPALDRPVPAPERDLGPELDFGIEM